MPSTRVHRRTLRHLSLPDRQLLARVKRAVLSVEPRSEVTLYGSRARGDAMPDSDWDLLVLLDGPVDWRRTDTVSDKIYDVELREAGCPVLSTSVHSQDEWRSPPWQALPYHASAKREGVLL